MLTAIIAALCGFAFGLGATLYFVQLENKRNKAQVSFLTNDIVHSLENILHHYRQNYRFHDINYKMADLQQDAWHNKFLMEKFFLITGLYEMDSAGHVRVRSNIDAHFIEKFLAEIKNGEFNKLLAIVADIPSGAFYSYNYQKKPNPSNHENDLQAHMPKNNLL